MNINTEILKKVVEEVVIVAKATETAVKMKRKIYQRFIAFDQLNNLDGLFIFIYCVKRGFR